ncbi:hypothetical protein OCF84_20710 (plasmid) [Shewanella xiamenensis]|uniref:Uncharacterized protein n=1 Tax=Shewanella xiamenensis TaxID=332186 RepID=A0ABT6UFR1_9GAMM|nr:hypothetical protein [Shewanella xiamenensis]MDI5833310.1 hypothetical protein [Shewanella xiamenensis]WHF57940.1 hypothetical protein OCF84_20710 [Shewanella xiamenensis]
MRRESGLKFINLERRHAKNCASLCLWLESSKLEKWQTAELILELSKDEDEFLAFIDANETVYKEHLLVQVPSRTRRPTSDLADPISPNLALMLVVSTKNNSVRNDALNAVLSDKAVLKSGYSVLIACCTSQDLMGINKIFDAQCWYSTKELNAALNEFVASAKELDSSDGSLVINILKRFAEIGVRVYDAMIFDVPIVEVFIQKGLDNVAAFLNQERLIQVLDDAALTIEPNQTVDIDESLLTNSL